MSKASRARLDRDKEIFVTDNQINGIITYYFPEMF